ITPTGFSFLFKNRGNTESTGFTLEAQGKIAEAWSWSANYTNIDVNDRLTIPAAVRAFFPPDYQDSHPPDTANAQATFEQGHWLATLTAHYQSSSHELALTPSGFQPQNIKPFYDVGAKLGYRIIDRVWLTASGTNLLRHMQRESSIGMIE